MSIDRQHWAGGVLVIVLVGPVLLEAQKSASGRLEAITSATCEFPVQATGTWTTGTPSGDVKPATLSLRFHSIDAQGGTAETSGAFGVSHIIARLSAGALHFLQIGSAGPLHATTIFDSESRDGKLKAVHTRHEYTEVALPGYTSRPEQYYGECEPEG